MKNIKEIKNLKFHQQMKGEKLREVTIILLLSFNNKTVYDIVCNKNNNELQQRIKELDNNNIRGLSYVAVTEKNKFIEYKRKLISK